MNDLAEQLGVSAEPTEEELARIKAALMAGQSTDSISEGEMEPMTVTGRRGVVQMPEEQIRGKKTINLEPMTIDPRASVKIGKVSVSRPPPATVAESDEDMEAAADRQHENMLVDILRDEQPLTTAEEPLPPRDREGNALRRQNEAGPSMGITPERRAAQAALERAQNRGKPVAVVQDTRTGPKLAEAGEQGGPAPEGEKVATGGGRGPMNWLGGVALGAAPQRTREQEAREALQRAMASVNANRKASVAAFARNVEQGMNTAYGTPNPRVAGTGLAEAGQAGLRATLAQQQQAESNRRAAAGEQATENQQAMAAQNQLANQALRAQAEDNQTDLDRARLEIERAKQLRPQATRGGGGGLKPSDFAKWKLPKDSYSIEQGGREMDAIVNELGGWDKVKGVGFVEGAIPKAALEPKAQRLRQLAESMIIPFRHGYFGAALTPGEKASMDRAIATIEGGKTVSEIVNGMQILRRINQNKVDEALAMAPPEVQARAKDFYAGKGVDTFGTRAAKPDAAAPAAKEPTGYRWTADRKKRKPVYADGSEGPIEEVR